MQVLIVLGIAEYLLIHQENDFPEMHNVSKIQNKSISILCWVIDLKNRIKWINKKSREGILHCSYLWAQQFESGVGVKDCCELPLFRGLQQEDYGAQGKQSSKKTEASLDKTLTSSGACS